MAQAASLVTDNWIPRSEERRQSFFNLAFLLQLETLFTLTTTQELNEFNGMSTFLYKLDHELQEHQKSGRKDEERLETLDASLAANIIQSRLENVQTEINDLGELRANLEAKERKEKCESMKFKLQEGLVRLYSMLNEYPKAVKLALNTGMTVEAQNLANRPRNELQRK